MVMCYSNNREEFGPSLQSWCNSEEACRPFGSYHRCPDPPHQLCACGLYYRGSHADTQAPARDVLGSVAKSCPAARQASLSFTISQSLLRFMSIESMISSNHLILCCPLLLLPSMFTNIRVFSNELAHHIRWPKYWGFSFSISPFNEHSGLIYLGLIGLISL